MTEEWLERMYAGIGKSLRAIGVDATRVTDFDEDATAHSWAYSEYTAGEDIEFEFSVTYLNSAGVEKVYYGESKFTDFIKGIT